ncbi:MAG: GGDEF domain-containing protein [Nitrosomonadales bacterium]|nr:GGDEF domain-containing protein [Nitrosomonadales bacterium]
MNLSPEILEALESAPLFHGVPSKLFSCNINESNLRTLNAGETLLVPGEVSHAIYIILSGRLNILLTKSDAEPVAMLGKGECAGEMSILGDAQDQTYVVAATDCDLLAFEHDALWELIDISHQAAHNMLNVLSARIRPGNRVMTESLEHHHGFSGASVVDELTGLYNRQWVEEKFSRHLNRDFSNNKPSCIMLLEIDGFNEFSGKYGQLGSEQALRDTAHTMLSCLRPDDQAGRHIGEQFAVFMPNTALADGCIAAERLKTAISGSMIVLPSGDALPSVTVSVGVYMAKQGDTLADLFARAGEVLREAAKSGGNCVKWYEKDNKSNTAQLSAGTDIPVNTGAPASANTVLPPKPFMSLWSGAHPNKNGSTRA